MYTEWKPTPNIMSSSFVCDTDLEFMIENENNLVATKKFDCNDFPGFSNHSRIS